MIAPVSVAHAGLLAELHGRCFAEGWTAKAMGDLLAMPGCFGFIAGKTAPLGFVLAAETGIEAEILTLAVLPDVRRRGLARSLMEAVVTELERRGVARLLLEVAAGNRAARCLYEGMGMEEAGHRPGYYQGGDEDAIIMAADIQDLRISNR